MTPNAVQRLLLFPDCVTKYSGSCQDFFQDFSQGGRGAGGNEGLDMKGEQGRECIAHSIQAV